MGEPVCEQKLGRVRRESAHRKNAEVFCYLIGIFTVVIHLAVEICGHTGVDKAQTLAEGSLSEVEVH